MTDRPGQISDEDLLLLLRGGWMVEGGPEDFSAVASTWGRMCMEAASRVHEAMDQAVELEPSEARGLP